MTDISDIRKFYDDFSPRLQRDRQVSNKRHEHIKAHLMSVIKPGMRVLDIGCGTGVTTDYIAGLVGESGLVTGVDLSDANIIYARKRNERENAEFLCADICKFNPEQGLLPDFDSSIERTASGFKYDAIIAADVIEHIPAKRLLAFIKNIAALSHDDTIIYINVPYAPFTSYMWEHHPEAMQIEDRIIRIEGIASLFSMIGFTPIWSNIYGIDAPYQYLSMIFVTAKKINQYYSRNIPVNPK